MMTKPVAQSIPPEPEDAPLSAFLDGELSDENARLVLQRLSTHPGAQARFSEYCAIGDALRGNDAAGMVAPGFTNRVMAALEQEPTLLAPMRSPQDRRAALWLAAAAVSAITWGLWNSLPNPTSSIPMAANDVPPSVDVQPYLAAHQDFAQAVIAPAEMNFTQVSLAEARQ